MSGSVLIVEDEGAVGEMLCAHLNGVGYTAVTVESAEEALAAVAQTPVDAVITDLKMPGMNGLSLAQKLLQEDPDRPVLLMTAFADLDSARRAIGIGVYEYFVKPARLSEIETGVQRALDYRRLVLENRAYQRDLEQKVEARTRALKAANEQLQREITRRRRNEEALRTSEEKLRGIAERSIDIIYQVDAAGCITYVSPAVERILGYTPEELVGKPVQDYVPASEIPEAVQALADAEQGKSLEGLQLEVAKKDGSVIPVEVNASSLVRDGRFAGTVGIVRDITERRKAEEALRRAHEELELRVEERTAELKAVNEKLQCEIAERKRAEQELIRMERLRALQEMAAGVSHNINNILCSILTPAEIIQDLTDNPEVISYTEYIITSAARAADLVQRLRRAVQDVEEATLYPVAVNDAVQKVLEATQPGGKDEATAGEVSIEAVTDLQEVPPIQGTDSELSEIFVNLVCNAVDAMPEGGTITIATRSVDDRVQITVRDTGIGMDEEVHRRIFDPFFTTKADVGSGLGLSTVHGIVTRWGGTIDVESTPGKGTAFTIQFPVWSEYEATQRIRASILQERRGKILIAEQEKAYGRLLHGLLSLGHNVSMVLSGDKALDLLAANRYDVVLIDQEIQGAHVNELVRKIRHVDASTAIVLLTRRAISEADSEMPEVDFRIQKPFDSLSSVEEVVAQAVRLHETRNE